MTSLYQLQRRPWVFAVNVLSALLAWFSASFAPGGVAAFLSSGTAAVGPLLGFTALFAAGLIADLLGWRVACFLNPVAQNSPLLGCVVLWLFPATGVSAPEGFGLVLLFTIVPAFVLSTVSAYLYWRDIRDGAF